MNLNDLLKKEGMIALINKDVSYLDKLLLDPDGILQPVPAAELKKIPHTDLLIWANKAAVYQLVTTEMIEWLKGQLAGYNAIEIGAGYGTIGRSLNIPITDSKLQDRADIKAYYALHNQPIIKYPKDVIKMEAQEAIDYFKPDAIVGAFITQRGTVEERRRGISCAPEGVQENQLLKKVKKYIVFGNKATHAKKYIYMLPHQELHFDWLFNRGIEPALNRGWIFNTEPSSNA